MGYDVDSLDFQDPGAAAVQANVLDHVQPGSIVSLHFGHQGTIAAFGPSSTACAAAGCSR